MGHEYKKSTLEKGLHFNEFFLPDKLDSGDICSQNDVKDIEQKVIKYFEDINRRFPNKNNSEGHGQIILRDLCPYFIIKEDDDGSPVGEEKYGICDPISLIAYTDPLSLKKFDFASKNPVDYVKKFEFNKVDNIISNLTQTIRYDEKNKNLLTEYILNDSFNQEIDPCFRGFNAIEYGLINNSTSYEDLIWVMKSMHAFFARKKNNFFIKQHVAEISDRFSSLIYGPEYNKEILYKELNPVEQAVVNIYAIGDWMEFGINDWLEQNDCSKKDGCNVCKEIQKPYLINGQQTALLEFVPGHLKQEELKDFYGGITLKVVPSTALSGEENQVQSWELKKQLREKLLSDDFEPYFAKVRDEFNGLEKRRRYLRVNPDIKTYGLVKPC